MNLHRIIQTALALVFFVTAVAAQTTQQSPQPTLFIIGDSTVKNTSNGQLGWGDPIRDFFDLSKIKVDNRARGGRSSRTFLSEGLWDQVLAELKPGDFVLMQFGHNDGGPINDESRARGSLPGLGDQFEGVDNQVTKKFESVHTFGWYMRKFVSDTKAKGATPIVLSPIPRNIWVEGKVERAAATYGGWAAAVAKSQNALFIDLNEIVAARYEAIGQETIARDYFKGDHTHTSPIGARLNAESVVTGMRALKNLPLTNYLLREPVAEHLAKAEAYLKESKYQEASLEFRNALQIDGNLSAAHWGLARCYESLGRFPEMFQELQTTVATDPNNLEARTKLGNYYLVGSKGKPEDLAMAEKFAKEVLQKDPNNVEGHILLGSVLFAQNLPDKALAELNHAIELDPKRIESYLSLARFYVVTRDQAKAEELFKRAIATDPNSPVGHIEYGKYLAQNNRTDEAEVELKKAVEVAPTDKTAKFVLASFYLVNKQQSAAPTSEVIKLWPQGAPGALGTAPEDIPTLTPFIPTQKTNGSAVIVCPGGGYTHLADHEGKPVAEWLNSLGITAFVLKYRIGPKYHHPAPLLDAARAVRLIRSRAAEWKLDPKKIGVLGFSAGGHVASTIGTHFDAGQADAPDPIDRLSSRPDLLILIYPVVSMGKFTHGGSKKQLLGDSPTPDMVKLLSNEEQVTKDTPPTFLVHTANDSAVPVENSLQFVEALRKVGVPFEMHIYERGPHGFGLGGNNPILSTWPARCADWLRLQGF